MQGGWIKVWRQLRDHPIWSATEKFCQRATWIDLMLEANHQDREIRVGNRQIVIRRGQVFISQRELAKRWRWNHKKVKRFLDGRQVAGSLTYETVRKVEHGYTLITITNYGQFQDSDEQEGSANGSAKGNAKGAQMGHKQEGKNYLAGKEEEESLSYTTESINKRERDLSERVRVAVNEDGWFEDVIEKCRAGIYQGEK